MRFRTLKIYFIDFLIGLGPTLLFVTTTAMVLVVFLLGFIDKPVFKSKLKGKVETCGYYQASRLANSSLITCRAKLENDLIVYFSSNDIKKAGLEVIYAEYERPYTHMTKYIQLF